MSGIYSGSSQGSPMTPMTPMTIELEKCSLASRANRIRLQQTSITFAPGLVTAVIGPNGGGKSTLLGIASATVKPSSGRVLFNGQSVLGMDARLLAQSRAVLTQDLSVSFGFSVHDVVGWGRTPWRGTQRQRQDSNVIAAALQNLEISGLVNRPINELSGGECKRVHLARILAQETQCVLMDEPDSDLDLAGLAALDSTIVQMNTKGKTMIVSSHDIQRISQVADCVVVVAGQTVVEHGPTRSVITSEVLSKAYGIPVRVEWGESGITHLSIVQFP